MNCTSVLSFFHSKSTMPIELAMPLYLSRDDYRQRRCLKKVEPLRPCLPRPIPPRPEESGAAPGNRAKTKKQVSFADHKGLSLTAVKVFSEFEDPIDIPLSVRDLLGSMTGLCLAGAWAGAGAGGGNDLVLDFAQPSSDYLLFRRRLEQQKVCLEHCTLRERSLSGTVAVRNLSYEKTVKVRITFDTWKTHADVECGYVKDTYAGGSDRDTFSFQLGLPEELRPHERVEFAVCYQAAGQAYWDSNQDQNYGIVRAALKKGRGEGSTGGPQRQGPAEPDIQMDPYGSPRCSHGIFPDWPSYAAFQEVGPYY
ncbi:protein phosphatase 1 regulatory subunit 3B isoform X1 [Conger conger]|uniref:protein phosphatase 1 regulatory subunit 3B isoform X1 n=2 Tax=Conger conger TaxID=82655 RepID=UPI002A5AF9E0|nr:protein phosphatase 1 regulatory subunit 3B isoform X1 [Conger conger]